MSVGRTFPLVLGLFMVSLTACSDSDAGGKGAPSERGDGGSDAEAAYQSAIYADESKWLCWPGKTGDHCRENLDATSLLPDGTTEVVPHVFAEAPAVDCFYVYPTISGDEAANSDFEPAEAQEINVVREQAARLSGVCNVYAPIYRQVTLSSLVGTVYDVPVEQRREIAYADVLDAWKHFLAQRSLGRPFVLAGHSQGTGVLRRLIQEEIDGVPAMRQRLVSALLIGGDIAVPEGADVGEDFENVPLCRSTTDVGCVVAYSAFRSDAPPPENSRFGRSRTGSGVAACTHPASLAGGSAYLTPYFKAAGGVVAVKGELPAVSTPYVTLPDFLGAECVSEGGFSYLKVTVEGDPADPRPDDIGGDLTPDWGLHLADVHLAMGDLVTLAGSQIEAFVE